MVSVTGGVPTANSTIVLNGAALRPETVRRVDGDLAAARKTFAHDGADHLYFSDPKVCVSGAVPAQGDATSCLHPTYVASGHQMDLRTFQRNILTVDGQRMTLVGVDDPIQSPGEATQRVLHRLPPLNSKIAVGTVAVGAVGTALALGLRNPKSLLVTGLVAAGAAALAGVGVSWYQARHPGVLPEWLK